MKIIFAIFFLATSLCITSAHAETVLITGANRGLGLEFARQYAERGWTVIATARAPEEAAELQSLKTRYPEVMLARLDVLDEIGLHALADSLSDVTIDVLINNAGVLGELREQTLGTFDYATFQNVLGVNTYGPLAVSEAFKAHVARSNLRKIVGITSGSGVISGRVGGGTYFYKASKIGLNMVFRVLAEDLAAADITVALIAPGAVNTDMRRQAVGATRAAQDMRPEESVRAMIDVIDRLTREDSGRVFNFNGRALPW